jgi:hypothetical protein
MAKRLMVLPLLVLEQLRAPVSAERAGEDHVGDGLLQRSAPDLANRIAAGRASPVDANAAGIAHNVPVLALANQHMMNSQSDSPLQLRGWKCMQFDFAK